MVTLFVLTFAPWVTSLKECLLLVILLILIRTLSSSLLVKQRHPPWIKLVRLPPRQQRAFTNLVNLKDPPLGLWTIGTACRPSWVANTTKSRTEITSKHNV